MIPTPALPPASVSVPAPPGARPGPGPDGAPAPFVLTAHGRAHRVLDCVVGGPLQINSILKATDPRTYTRKVERNRIHRILWLMGHAGLVQLVHGRGWIATTAGLHALHALEAEIAHRQRGPLQ